MKPLNLLDDSAIARSVRTNLHERRRQRDSTGVRSVFTSPDSATGPDRIAHHVQAFNGPAHDYLPKPDNDPVPFHVEPGDFVMPTQAEINATRLEVERYKRRLLDASPTPRAGPHQ